MRYGRACAIAAILAATTVPAIEVSAAHAATTVSQGSATLAVPAIQQNSPMLVTLDTPPKVNSDHEFKIDVTVKNVSDSNLEGVRVDLGLGGDVEALKADDDGEVSTQRGDHPMAKTVWKIDSLNAGDSRTLHATFKLGKNPGAFMPLDATVIMHDDIVTSETKLIQVEN
ncbi:MULTISPECIES: hypothetical protein [unclassified Streptomyces]|uniref:hypothetical protein n=1 Tax=unclassified Streptomyces TaxID=2593676 RepID=UPI0037F9D1BC